MSDTIKSPAHYTQAGIECNEVVRAILSKEQYQASLWTQAFQYLWRCWHKGRTLEDVKKAVWFLDRLIESMEDV